MSCCCNDFATNTVLLMPGDDTYVEPVEQMAEAVLALATGDPGVLTGRKNTHHSDACPSGRAKPMSNVPRR